MTKRKIKDVKDLPYMTGRPTDYYPELCQEIINFFDRPLYEEKEVMVIERGRQVIKKVQAPCQLPTIERFALNMNLHKSTLYRWAEKHPEFSDALNTAKQAQQEILNQHALTGMYKEGYSKFVAVNFTDMKEKVEHSVSDNVKEVLKLNYSL
jgi:hypothetical protein